MVPSIAWSLRATEIPTIWPASPSTERASSASPMKSSSVTRLGKTGRSQCLLATSRCRERAMARPILATMRPASMSICNGAALLWRLDMLGCALGDRWNALAAKWDGHADGNLCVFPDIHAAMSELRAGDGAAIERRVQAMRKTAADGSELGAIYRDIGLPVVAGLI